ncbi:SRPBCC family protein [Streptomyces sp. NPDC086023]|uniref:SRPBCC family protein n=1 Tax=Streptomyces sp. NPDC086023 TaxID=3365746 RepID=UPI0037CDA3D8
MAHVLVAVEVAVSVRTAYDQWTQFEEFPLFMPGVESVTQRAPDLTRWVVDLQGVRRTFDARITQQSPDERVAWTTVGGEVSHSGSVTFHPLGDTDCRLVVQLDFHPSGPAERTAALLGVVQRRIKVDLEAFRTFIEKRGAATGGWRGAI